MFPVHRGLYAPRSTMHQFAKPGYLTFSPFPENNIDPNQSFHSYQSPEGIQSGVPSSDFFDIDISTPKESNLGQVPPYTKKSQSKAERRAEHNAIERARRETLNSKFQMLAQILPNLNSYRRPSKNQIIEKAFEWVKQSLYREERYRYQIMQLQNENRRLLTQLIPIQPIPHPDMISPPTSSQNIMSAPYTPSSLDNGWSDHHPPSSSGHLSPYGINTLEMPKQDFGSRSDEEDNTSSVNEDDIDYQSSTSKTSCTDQGTLVQQQQPMQPQERSQQQIANGYLDVPTHFNPTNMSSSYWNQNHISQVYHPLFTPPDNN
ncbi:hypothetical protein K501DRAFT_335646 [Backusella circina FSU 941]|nr:hypothetical protein K501DRAFT_335646 [Backusella circina FSU 941]